MNKVDPRNAIKTLGEWPSQKFHVSHLRDEDFKATGLRPWVQYRDLGVKDATGGLILAQVNRRNAPFRKEDVVQRHYHDVKFQMVYVLKGWTTFEMDGHGEHTVHAGGCWVQPAGIKHTVLGYSEDLEVLEVIIPADYDTVDVPNRAQDK
jgi:quercetin dioxygenase-like cupin family protein